MNDEREPHELRDNFANAAPRSRPPSTLQLARPAYNQAGYRDTLPTKF